MIHAGGQENPWRRAGGSWKSVVGSWLEVSMRIATRCAGGSLWEDQRIPEEGRTILDLGWRIPGECRRRRLVEGSRILEEGRIIQEMGVRRVLVGGLEGTCGGY